MLKLLPRRVVTLTRKIFSFAFCFPHIKHHAIALLLLVILRDFCRREKDIYFFIILLVLKLIIRLRLFSYKKLSPSSWMKLSCKINLSKFNKLSMNSAQNDFESFAGLVKHDLEFFGLNRARYTWKIMHVLDWIWLSVVWEINLLL